MHFYYILKGNFYVEYVGVGQGVSVFNLKAVSPKDISNYVNKR